MTEKPFKILSVLPLLGHPRDSKRISMLQAAGFQVEVAAFERDYHAGRMPACPITSLGHIKHGHYLSRAFKMIRSLPILRRALRRHSLAYASGPDMALFAIVAGVGLRSQVVLEVGDIRHVQIAKGWKGWLARRLDRFIVNHSQLLVVTARGFADGYYGARLKSSTRVLVIENKLDEAPLTRVLGGQNPKPQEVFHLGMRPIKIGYFGVLRCPWSWEVLTHIAQSLPDRVHVIVAGYSMLPANICDKSKHLANFEYRGEYRSPEDLPALYGEVDLVWACYPSPEAVDPDWRWALSVCRSNRFYESCFFQRPLVSMAESGDGVEVDRLGIGLTLVDQSNEGVLRAITGITSDAISCWNNNLAKVPRSIGVYTNETGELQRAILDVIARTS